MLLQQFFPGNFIMAYPVERLVLSKFGIFDTPVVAALVPIKMVKFTNQEI